MKKIYPVRNFRGVFKFSPEVSQAVTKTSERRGIISNRINTAVLVTMFCLVLLGAGMAVSAQTLCPSLSFQPSISIPGSSINKDTPMTVNCRSIGNYILEIYRFGVLVASFLAAIMLMIGGFIWLTAGGNAAQVSTAHSFVAGALSGFVLLLASWVLLNTINPNLVRFEPLEIKSIDNVPLAPADQLGAQEHCCKCKESSGLNKCWSIIASKTSGVCVCNNDPNTAASVPNEAACLALGAGCVYQIFGITSSPEANTACLAGMGSSTSATCELIPGACGGDEQCKSMMSVAKQGGKCELDAECDVAGGFSCNHFWDCSGTSGAGNTSYGNKFYRWTGVSIVGCCMPKGIRGQGCVADSDCISNNCGWTLNLVNGLCK